MSPIVHPRPLTSPVPPSPPSPPPSPAPSNSKRRPWPWGNWREEEATRLVVDWPELLVRSVLGPYAQHVRKARLREARVVVWVKRHPWSLAYSFLRKETTFTVTLSDGRREVLDLSDVEIPQYERVVRGWLAELLGLGRHRPRPKFGR